MPATDTQTQGTPFAPSVEKAYYRKCIELKRRLNDVEAANDEAKIKRVRLDRAIMKMRLERAFLLEQLSKRMDVNVDGSEGSGDEGPAVLAAIPPQHSVPLVPVPSTPGYGPPQHGSPHCAPVGVPGATAAHAQPNGHHGYDGAADEREPLPHVQANANRSERATGEALSAGPAMREESNGEGRIVADNSGAALETPDEREEMRAMGGGGFNAINH
ncbi:hypothetical protein B0A55_11115 [Friedmanniomyces simplex]|uniref:INO80 complex subunit F domain-containing protein n=1 Tax=Friedmanniomyces simplex TaxID=329884 RepID=A0A4U0WN98_9PEZI|nr:hypothetical protein B0A55_11115 [Friedmanniomyces simplex]